MSFLKFLAIVILSVITFVMAISLLKLVGIVLNLIWLVAVAGIFVMAAWLIYKLLKPRMG